MFEPTETCGVAADCASGSVCDSAGMCIEPFVGELCGACAKTYYAYDDGHEYDYSYDGDCCDDDD